MDLTRQEEVVLFQGIQGNSEMSFIRSSKTVQSIALLSLGRKTSTAPGGTGAVQTLGHHTSVPAFIAMQGCQINSSVSIGEC